MTPPVHHNKGLMSRCQPNCEQQWEHWIKSVEMKECNNFSLDQRMQGETVPFIKPLPVHWLKQQSHNHVVTSIDLDEWTCLLRDLQSSLPSFLFETLTTLIKVLLLLSLAVYKYLFNIFVFGSSSLVAPWLLWQTNDLTGTPARLWSSWKGNWIRKHCNCINGLAITVQSENEIKLHSSSVEVEEIVSELFVF